jgi:hypothetical protein
MAVNLIGYTDIIKHVFDDGVSRRAVGATPDLDAPIGVKGQAAVSQER